MIDLLLSALSVVGAVFLVGTLFVAWVLVVGYYHRRSLSATEDEAEPETTVARTVHPNCRSTMVSVDGSGQTISGTWTEHSATETSTTSGREGPSGFRGEDLSDREVEEWLREWGLSGYD